MQIESVTMCVAPVVRKQLNCCDLLRSPETFKVDWMTGAVEFSFFMTRCLVKRHVVLDKSSLSFSPTDQSRMDQLNHWPHNSNIMAQHQAKLDVVQEMNHCHGLSHPCFPSLWYSEFWYHQRLDLPQRTEKEKNHCCIIHNRKATKEVEV